MKKFVKITSCFLFFLASATAFSQEALKSTEEEYYDFLALQGLVERPTLNYRTLSDSKWKLTEEAETSDLNVWKENNLGTTKKLSKSISFKFYGPEWFSSYNTKAPYGQNDGALWQGKGYNASFSTGVRFEGYGFELTLKPQLTWSQNKEFEIMHGVYGSEYSYFWKGNIDLVQRYGDASFGTFDWGDTEVRYTWHTLTAGFGFQSPWLGPAWLNPMLGSNNAGTYPKFDFGLRKTKVYIPFLDWYIGDIEGRVWIGKLTESDYFDNDTTNDTRQITGFSAAYSPSFFPGFTIGANKICINYWKDKSAKYLNPFYDTNNQLVQEDQKASFFVSQVFPQVGFEVYGELGVDDYSSKKIENPFHTAIYTVGTKKTFPISKKHGIFGEIIFEWSNFEMSQDFQLQWRYMGYYAHGGIMQGYTQKGQILGAGSGYFGNSQYLAFRTWFPKGSATLFMHFNRPDTNYINNMAVGSSSADWTLQHEQWALYKAIRTYGINVKYFITPEFLLGAEFNTSWIVRENYQKNDKAQRNNYCAIKVKYNL